MGNLTRILIVWVVLFVLSLIALFLFNQFGEQLVQRVQAESVLAQCETLESSGRIDKAIALYEKHKKPILLPALTRAYMKAGRYEKALEQANEVLDGSTGKDKIQAYLLISRVYAAMGRHDEAYDALNQAIPITPKSAEVRYELAKTFESRREYRSMKGVLKTAADLKTKNSSEEYEKEYELRKSDLRDLKKQTKSGDICYRLGIAYKEFGEWENAVNAFEEASGFDDAVGDVYFWLGVDAETDGEFGRAEAMYTKAAEICPTHLNALINLNRISLRLKTEARPNDSRAWHALGLANFELNNLEDAFFAFEKAVETNPRSAEAHAMLGRTLERTGSITDAREAYKKAVQIAPIHQEALQGLHRTEPREQNAE